MRINDIYKRLTSDQKISFWTMTTNIVLVVFTAWLGFLVQDIIVSKNTNIQSKLVQYEYGEKLFPAINNIYVNGNPYNKLIPIATNKQLSDEDRMRRTFDIMNVNKNEFLTLGDSVVSVMGRLKYFIDYKNCHDIETNNATIYTCNAIIREMDSIQNNPEYPINTQFISEILNSKDFYLYCGANSANREQLDSLYTEISKIRKVNSVTFRSLLQMCYVQQSIAVIQNLSILHKISENHRKESAFQSVLPYILLIMCFICIICTMWVIANFIVPKGIHRKYSDEDYNELMREYKSECVNTSVRENTIFRLNKRIAELEGRIQSKS